MEISENGKRALKILFSDFLTSYNAYSIRKKLRISQVGSLKLLRSLNDKGLVTSQKMGNAIFYKPNLSNGYVLKLLELIYSDYSSFSSFVKGWIYDLQPLSQDTKAIFLFGSILTKEKAAGDVDVCFILKSPQDYSKLQRKVNELNKKNRLNIHPLFLTEGSFREKLKEKEAPLIDLVKMCVVVYGQELFVGVLKDVQS
ncbi:MAG: hypothetical protein V1702_05600 [Candidatus Woesearchaeota archaeon]